MAGRGRLLSMTTEPANPADLGATPGVIPYVEFHTGPRRVLTIELTTDNSRGLKIYRPVVSIDGRQYVVVWGPVSWEIPIDRNVHVSVHLHGEHLAQAASLILSPGEERKVLLYATASGGIGSLTEAPRPATA